MPHGLVNKYLVPEQPLRSSERQNSSDRIQEKTPPKKRAAFRAVLAQEIQHHHFPQSKRYANPSRCPTPSEKRRCKTLEEAYVVRRPRNETDNPPTNPSTGETARVGWRVVSPSKRPPNPGNQTVIVLTGDLGQGYKPPGHPAALSLGPCLHRLPAGDG